MVFPHVDRTARSISVGGAVALVVSLAAGCAGVSRDQLAYSPERFVIATQEQAPGMAVEDIVVPFRVTPEMVAKAREVTARSRSDYDKAQSLMAAITSDDGFGLYYESVATATPDVTVARGYGNCLALTSIFIGLARQLGLSAYYVDASDRVNDLRRDGTLIVDSGHIAGGVRTERGYTLVDYDGHAADYRTFKMIDDITALAHYYNNLGFEMISDAEREGNEIDWEIIRYKFELATKVRPSFTLAYNNLGVAYTRLGKLNLAEEAYLKVLEIDPKSDATYHNLGNFKMRRRDFVGALHEYDLAVDIEKRNPYLYYHRGVAQYRLNDFEAAKNSFKKAISLERDYIEPRNLLAQVYTQLGRHEEAAKIRAAVQRLLAEQRRK